MTFDVKDPLWIKEEKLSVFPMWKILPGATYKLSYQQVVDLLNDEGIEEYKSIADTTGGRFTVTHLGRYIDRYYDHTLIFIKELGKHYSVPSNQEIETLDFVELLPMYDVKKHREAYELMLKLESGE